MIRVLVVDDSKVIQEFMVHLLSSDPEIEVIGIAGSGLEALQQVEEKHPDVITMDVHMPVMDGFEATRAIMESTPTPIVIVSGSLQVKELKNSFKLIEAGALAVVLRPPSMNTHEHKEARKNLIRTVKLMSEVKVIRRFPRQDRNGQAIQKTIVKPENNVKAIKIIAIGASTGGPLILQNILSTLPGNLPVPVVIVQHIAKGFINGFRDWLSISSKLTVKIAVKDEALLPGNVYLAPDDYQMGISFDFCVTLQKPDTEKELCPSVDFLFRSVAEIAGQNSAGVLLTGMGKDGAVELKRMKEKGAFTIAQDEATSVIFGMPGEAIKIGAATQVLPSGKIAEALVNLFADK